MKVLVSVCFRESGSSDCAETSLIQKLRSTLKRMQNFEKKPNGNHFLFQNGCKTESTNFLTKGKTLNS